MGSKFHRWAFLRWAFATFSTGRCSSQESRKGKASRNRNLRRIPKVTRQRDRIQYRKKKGNTKAYFRSLQSPLVSLNYRSILGFVRLKSSCRNKINTRLNFATFQLKRRPLFTSVYKVEQPINSSNRHFLHFLRYSLRDRVEGGYERLWKLRSGTSCPVSVFFPPWCINSPYCIIH